MKLSVYNPNFSIVVPTGCNANCGFCFWQKKDNLNKKDYLKYLRIILKELPEQFEQCSITGGEPTILPWLVDILKLVRKRFKKVVMSSNGSSMRSEYFDYIDHLNISRHGITDIMNYKTFKTTSVPSTKLLKAIFTEANYSGIDVTLNCVLDRTFNSLSFINNYIQFAKEVNANAVCFRKEHSDLISLPVETILMSKIIRTSDCPVCRTSFRLINGMLTTWKYSVMEPSNDLGGIYELIMQSDGTVTSDWKGRNIIMNIKTKELKELIREIIKEELDIAKVKKSTKKKSTKKAASTTRKSTKSVTKASSCSYGSSLGRAC